MHITISQQTWIANVIASECNFIYVYHIGHVVLIIILQSIIKPKYTKILLHCTYTLLYVLSTYLKVLQSTVSLPSMNMH